MSRRREKAHPCPTATKSSWPDEAAAVDALEHVAYEYSRAPVREKIPTRAYLCECGRWHLTSAPKEVHDAPPATPVSAVSAMARIHAAAARA